MKSKIILTGLFLLIVISLTNYTQAYQTEIGDGVFIFVQTSVRNSEGQLVVYLESSKFTNLNLEMMESFLDLEASIGNDPIVTINEKEYQVIRRVHSMIFPTEDFVASTNLSDNIDGQIIHLARFAHDGYTVSAGDSMESMWTFVRPVS
ncbi:MAG: hypothetical protein OEL77_07080 [Nitrosopumilus sp.]|nr:hypothetical protein [Nitrosopumilus sp.]MDH3385759.1 hypothetical protein [Nitrosopumilus sp.]